MTAYQAKIEPFDLQHWQAMLRDVFHQVRTAYPAGCFDYLKSSDPGRVATLKATVAKAKSTYFDQDSKGLDDALTAYRDAHLQTFEEFRRGGGGPEKNRATVPLLR